MPETGRKSLLLFGQGTADYGHTQGILFFKTLIFIFEKDYILNHLYDIESDQLQARGASREALFIPMGWDTEKRISLLTEGPELPTTIVTPRQR